MQRLRFVAEVLTTARRKFLESSLIDEDCLLPFVWYLVRAMNAARPATGPFLSFKQFITGSLDATLSGLWLLCIIDPTNELVTTKGRKPLPECKGIRI